MAGPHTVYIGPGTYTAVVTLNNTNWASSTWTGVADLNALAPAAKGQVTLQYGSGNTVNIAGVTAGVSFRNLSITNTGSGGNRKCLYISAANFSGSNLYLYDAGETVLNITTGGTNFSIQRSFVGGSPAGNAVTIDGNSSGLLAYNIFSDTPRYPLGTYSGNGLYLNSSGVVNVYNNEFTGLGRNAISVAAGTADISNNVILAGDSTAFRGYCIVRSGGTVTANNNLCLPTPAGLSQGFSGEITSSYNIFGGNPGWSRTSRVGYIIPRIDDTSNYSYARNVETLLADYGWSGTWYASSALVPFLTAEQRADLPLMVQRGTMEIGSHTRSHADMTGGIVASVTAAQGTNPQYNIDLATHTFSVKTDEGTWDRTYNLAADNSDMLRTVRNSLRLSNDNWDFSYSDDCMGPCYSDSLRVSSLNDSGGWQPISVPMTFDASCPDISCGGYKDEIANDRTELASYIGAVTDAQTGLPYAVNSFAYPFQRRNANSDTAVRTARYTSGSAGLMASNLQSANIDLYKLYSAGDIIGASGAATVANVHAVAAQAAQNGYVYGIITHNDDGISSDPASTNGWPQILAALKPWVDAGLIKVMSAQQVAAELRSAPWNYDSNTGISSRSWTDESDYSLLPTSSLRDAGINVGLAADYLGNPIVNSPDIGAHEYQPRGGGSARHNLTVSQPTLEVKETEVKLSWQTQENTTYVLSWQEKGASVPEEYVSPERKKDFSHTISRLRPETAYNYILEIRNDRESSRMAGEFTTKASASGESRPNGENHDNTATTRPSQAPTASYIFIRNLSYGSQGEDVSELQKFLISQGYLTSDSITGYFGPKTQTALQAFQKAHGIVSWGTPETTGYGNFGALSRARINTMLGAASSGTAATTIQSLQELIVALQEQLNALSLQLLVQIKR